MSKQELSLQDRIIGLLLRDARESAGRTKTECAEALGVSVSTITAYEEGDRSISLPELEVLAYLLDTPIDRFWQENPELKTGEENHNFQELLEIRHRIIGALVRQARLEADMTQKEVAELLGCSSSCVSSYEYGKREVPVSELRLLARHFGLSMDYFLDEQEGPVGEWHRQQRIERRFHKLPREVQEFVTKPINIKYLEVAMRLSKMPAGGMRDIAEGLLEITY